MNCRLSCQWHHWISTAASQTLGTQHITTTQFEGMISPLRVLACEGNVCYLISDFAWAKSHVLVLKVSLGLLCRIKGFDSLCIHSSIFCSHVWSSPAVNTRTRHKVNLEGSCLVTVSTPGVSSLDEDTRASFNLSVCTHIFFIRPKHQ